MTPPAPLPPWEETTREAATWDRDWFDRDNDDTEE
jgi:hypothetical protein